MTTNISSLLLFFCQILVYNRTKARGGYIMGNIMDYIWQFLLALLPGICQCLIQDFLTERKKKRQTPEKGSDTQKPRRSFTEYANQVFFQNIGRMVIIFLVTFVVLLIIPKNDKPEPPTPTIPTTESPSETEPETKTPRPGERYTDTITYENGDRYVGEIVDGMRDGNGTLYYSTKDRYVGEWKADKREGTGILYYNDNKRYEGEWKADQKEGTGSFYWPDGTCFEGNWHNGMRLSLIHI